MQNPEIASEKDPKSESTLNQWERLAKEHQNTPLSLQGNLPAWLKGTYVRNGPVYLDPDLLPDPPFPSHIRALHWFDGPACLFAFSFDDQKVTYNSRFLRTEVFHRIFQEKKFDFDGFANKRNSSNLHKWVSFLLSPISRYIFPHKARIQNANVNVINIANYYCAVTETPLPVRFDLKTLETLGALDYQDQLPKEKAFESAHAQLDGKTGEQINYEVEFGVKSYYTLFRLNPHLPKREIIGKIPVKHPAYMHSFALTEHYIILVEFPFVVNPPDLLLKNKPFILNYQWEPKRGTHFKIIDRQNGHLVKELIYDLPFFSFHHVNAYEENHNIILDLISYPDASIIFSLSDYPKKVKEMKANDNTLEKGRLTRYTISLEKNEIHGVQLFHESIEYPRIHPAQRGYPYRYLYGIDPRPFHDENELRSLYKLDLKTGEKKLWQEPGMILSEPEFIPTPNSRDEDDGIILFIAVHVKNKQSFLMLLDAKNCQEICRIAAPEYIPIGLHGSFFKA